MQESGYIQFKLAVTHKDDDTPHDLTTYDSLRMHVKENAKDTTYVLKYDTTGATIVVYDTNKIELKQTATVMQLEAKSYVYDVEGLTGAVVVTLFGGGFTVVDDVTRDGDTPA